MSSFNFDACNRAAQANFLPNRRLYDLINGDKYLVKRVRMPHTRYGQAVCLVLRHLKDGQVDMDDCDFSSFLPKRLAEYFVNNPVELAAMEEACVEGRLAILYNGNSTTRMTNIEFIRLDNSIQ